LRTPSSFQFFAGFQFLASFRSAAVFAGVAAGTIALSACSNPSFSPGSHEVSSPTAIAPTGAQAGDTIGTGPVKVALILPLTQGAGPSAVGASLRNAAELALSEAGSSDITLLVKDDHSTPDGAKAATQAALAEGADLVLGPLFAGDVKAAGEIGQASHRLFH